jgi:exodeoxyribonuclease VII large subunit
MELPERKIYTISELTEEIKNLLEGEYPSVWVQGEISNFRPAPSGHYYFTLKDETAQIRCVMFKTQNRFLKFKPEDGLQIIAWGRISVYAVRGEYQLVLDTMEPRGLGSLMLAFEQLRDKLAAEGLFDPARKKAIPPFPGTIGIVTSRRGAAIRDMIRITHRRSPGTNILLSPTSVQGDRAPEEIVAALERICKVVDIDVIIIGRGGGSIEDLWAFNDERVVRAVADCTIPVVSAVGHETDFTLTDFAADLRASTPSAAAELVVPDKRGLRDAVLHLIARLRGSISGNLERHVGQVNEFLKRLYDPRRTIEERRQRCDDLTTRLAIATKRRVTILNQEVRSWISRLRPDYLRKKTGFVRQEWSNLVSRLERAVRETLVKGLGSVEHLSARLEGLSPLAVLSRGYSITVSRDTGAVIKDVASVAIGEDVRVRLHRGEIDCRVTGKIASGE